MALSFGIRSSALPDGARVIGFRGTEALSRPYHFDIYVQIPGDEDVELADGIGGRATLRIEGGFSPVEYHGVLASLELLRAIEGNSLYQVRLVPFIWELSLTMHSRLFTKLNIPDVIKKVLTDEGVEDFEFRLKGTYEVEEHVCQYKESSLDFIHRWMEREGMYYFFEQTDSGEKLVIADDKTAHAPAKMPGAVPYDPMEGDSSARAHFDTFRARQGSLPGKIKLTDYDYLKPQLAIAGSAAVSNGLGEIQLYGNRFFTAAAGGRLAKVRAEELRAKAATYHASGPVLGLSAGNTFTLERHAKLALNTEYLVTQVEHHGHVGGAAVNWGRLIKNEHDDVYRVDVHAILAEQQYRHPETTPWPRLDGFENGTVDGPASSVYAQIDDHGRYNVKFKFDEGTLKDGRATTFVRMMQPHGGSPEGFHFPLRKDTEIICAFLGGDPDRPVIIGVVPNAITPSKVTSSNYTQNMIHTGGNNYITLEDNAGSQFVNIFCPIFETNLYLGVDRPVGGHGPTAPDAPGISPIGEFKKDLAPFNFDLRTSGSGRLSAKANIDVIAHNKLQMEGHAGVYEYAGTEWMRHVKGDVTEHTTGKETVNIDNDVSHYYHTTFKLGVAAAPEGGGTMAVNVTGTMKEHVTEAVTINYDNTLTQTNKTGTTLTDKAFLHHGVGGGQGPEATHSLKVTGEQNIFVTGEQTMHVGTNMVWTTDGNLEWTVGGDKKVEATSWHEETIAAKSEIIGGWKNDMVFGIHTEADVGNHTCFDAITKVEIVAAAQLEGNWGPKHNLRTEENTMAILESHLIGQYEADCMAVEFHCAFSFAVRSPLFQSTAALTDLE